VSPQVSRHIDEVLCRRLMSQEFYLYYD